MSPPRILKSLRKLTVLIGLIFCTALFAMAAPSPTPDPSPSASPLVKARPFPYQGVIVSVDKTAHSFRIGKNVVHQVHMQPETKLTQDEKPVAFETLAKGMEVRCSVRKRADGDYDAVSIKIGPKPTPTPAQP